MKTQPTQKHIQKHIQNEKHKQQPQCKQAIMMLRLQQNHDRFMHQDSVHKTSMLDLCTKPRSVKLS